MPPKRVIKRKTDIYKIAVKKRSATIARKKAIALAVPPPKTQIVTLPFELLEKLFTYLDPVSAMSLGLTSPEIYYGAFKKKFQEIKGAGDLALNTWVSVANGGAEKYMADVVGKWKGIFDQSRQKDPLFFWKLKTSCIWVTAAGWRRRVNEMREKFEDMVEERKDRREERENRREQQEDAEEESAARYQKKRIDQRQMIDDHPDDFSEDHGSDNESDLTHDLTEYSEITDDTGPEDHSDSDGTDFGVADPAVPDAASLDAAGSDADEADD